MSAVKGGWASWLWVESCRDVGSGEKTGGVTSLQKVGLNGHSLRVEGSSSGNWGAGGVGGLEQGQAKFGSLMGRRSGVIECEVICHGHGESESGGNMSHGTRDLEPGLGTS